MTHIRVRRMPLVVLALGVSAAVSALAACGREVPLEAIVVDSAGVRIIEHRHLGSTSPSATVSPSPPRRFGGADALPGEEIAEVMGLAVPVGRHVVVADAMSHALRRFSLDSGSAETVGREGEGPDEFLLPSIVGTLPGDSIVVYDARLRRVSIFGTAGSSARTFSVPIEVGPLFGAVGIVADTLLAFSGSLGVRLEGRQRVVQDTVPIVIVGPTGGLHAQFGAFPTQAYFEGPADGRPPGLELPFTPGARIAVGPTGIFVGSTDRFEIRRYDSLGRLFGIIRLPLSRTPVVRTDLDSLLSEALRSASSDAVAGVPALFRRMPTPDFKAPFEQLVVDAAGRLWVRTSSSDPATGAWLVFSPQGDFMGTGELPPGRLLHLGNDHLVILTRDQFDAQVIAVYELESELPSG